MIGVAAVALAIAGGGPAPHDHAVAAIVPRRAFIDDVPTQVLCTATLVAERAVLTAGHCVDDYGRGTLELHFGPRLDAPTHTRLVSDIVLHPQYSPTTSAFDLAVLWLNEPVALQPATIDPTILDGPMLDRSLRAVGWSSGERRTGQVAADIVDISTFTYLPDPHMTCRGDSGGPVMATTEGIERIVGVTSAGDIACEAWGAAARLDDTIAEWIAVAPAKAEAIVEIDAVCSQSCTSDAQCPGDLICADEGQCTVRGLEAGNLADTCHGNDACGSGVCVPMGATARCLDPCGDLHRDPIEPAGGCRIAGADDASGAPLRTIASWMLMMLVVVGRARRRSAPAS